jgi:bifunctional non-homologous end joining protein LigD
MSSLQRGEAKRTFDRAPAPRELVARPRGAQKLRFVIQKHAASTLHYDFRLELDGVLKSWAVTKEPEADPAHKRLAVATEDQALLDYVAFEGGVAAPEYGAAFVDRWDEGTWIPEEAPLAAYRRGRLTFELKGKRLKGRWALTRMGNAQTRRKKDLWLLAKLEDGAERARR